MNGDARLVNGGDESEGRLEICLNRVWGTVSNYGFVDGTVARVLCKQLGYTDKG